MEILGNKRSCEVWLYRLCHFPCRHPANAVPKQSRAWWKDFLCQRQTHLCHSFSRFLLNGCAWSQRWRPFHAPGACSDVRLVEIRKPWQHNTDVNLCPHPSRDMSKPKPFWALIYPPVTTDRQISQDPAAGDPWVQSFFLLFHFPTEVKASPPPCASFSFQRRCKEPGLLSGVSEETPKQKRILAGPGDETPPPLPVIPDGDFNGGADEADLFRKCLFASCDNWAVTFLERVADVVEKELTDVGEERTSTCSSRSHNQHPITQSFIP